jgi:TetR/AcrR family transcriptional regulator, regulator of autoinduction and epiphytic fitness
MMSLAGKIAVVTGTALPVAPKREEDRKLEAQAKRRIRRQPEDAKAQILDTAEKLMLEEGYAAVNTRRIAKELEFNASLVHYYFPTTDDLFVAAHERATGRQSDLLECCFQSEDPLRSLWDFQLNNPMRALGVEFLAVANHRKAIRGQIVAASEAARSAQTERLQPFLEGTGIDAEGVTTLVMAVARLTANEGAIGITGGHEALRNLVERILAGILARARTVAAP